METQLCQKPPSSTAKQPYKFNSQFFQTGHNRTTRFSQRPRRSKLLYDHIGIFSDGFARDRRRVFGRGWRCVTSGVQLVFAILMRKINRSAILFTLWLIRSVSRPRADEWAWWGWNCIRKGGCRITQGGKLSGVLIFTTWFIMKNRTASATRVCDSYGSSNFTADS